MRVHGGTPEQMAETLKFTDDRNQLHTAFASLQSQLNAEQEKERESN